MSQTKVPTIVYPNGGETILGNDVDIRWSNPGSDSDSLMRFSVIGDFGVKNSPSSQSIANQIIKYNPEFLVTLGDNFYDNSTNIGSTSTWDTHCGVYYSKYIKYKDGSTSVYADNGLAYQRFICTFGNHDWDQGIDSGVDYVNSPSTYYSIKKGFIEFFVLSSDPREPDGISLTSKQGKWFVDAVSKSKARWKIVTMHHPPYAAYHSGDADHYNNTEMRYNFKELGVHLILCGHIHSLQRIIVKDSLNYGLPVFIVGTGGQSLYGTLNVVPNDIILKKSLALWGNINVVATLDKLEFSFMNLAGNESDIGDVPGQRPVITHPESGSRTSKTYEILYSSEYDFRQEPNWQQIAVVPAASTSYTWRFGNALRSNKCRVGIRTRIASGERSKVFTSAGDFSIRRQKLSVPTIISPSPNERYDKLIEIVADDTALMGTYSQRSSYQFYYSSVSAGIPLTSIFQNIPVGSGPVIWNTLDLPPAKDYIFQAFLSDDDGNLSDSIYIKGIDIAHEGFFIVDTLPPVAAITINNNDSFTKSRNVNVQIVSYDAATSIHAMRLKDGLNIGQADVVANIKRLSLSEKNEIKTVQLLLQDYGANRNDELQKVQRLFETLVEVEDGIADITVDQSNAILWAVTKGINNNLYRVTDFASLVSTFEDEPTAISIYQLCVHVATKDDGNKSSLYRFNGLELETVTNFDEIDSTINTMTVHGTNLYLGMENGNVYSYDGLNLNQVAVLDNPVRLLHSDGSILYLVQKNDFNIYVFNGASFFATGE